MALGMALAMVNRAEASLVPAVSKDGRRVKVSSSEGLEFELEGHALPAGMATPSAAAARLPLSTSTTRMPLPPARRGPGRYSRSLLVRVWGIRTRVSHSAAMATSLNAMLAMRISSGRVIGRRPP